MPKANHPIPLSLQLWDKDASKYVRATIRLPSGGQHPSSPVSLSHVSDGFYTSTAAPMPNADFVSVFYEVFQNPEMTLPSQEHGEAFEYFELTYPPIASGDDLVAFVEDIG